MCVLTPDQSTCVAGSSFVDGSCVCKPGTQQTATGCQACGAGWFLCPFRNPNAIFLDPVLTRPKNTGTNPLVTPCVCVDPTTERFDANGNCYSCSANSYTDGGSCTSCPICQRFLSTFEFDFDFIFPFYCRSFLNSVNFTCWLHFCV